MRKDARPKLRAQLRAQLRAHTFIHFHVPTLAGEHAQFFYNIVHRYKVSSSHICHAQWIRKYVNIPSHILVLVQSVTNRV